MDLGLTGKRVVVTGASKGIGLSVAEAFAAEGAHLVLAARSGDSLQANAERIRARFGVEVNWHALDLSSEEDQAALIGFAGDASILVNNAGDLPGGNIVQVESPQWRAGWDLKVFGYVNLCRMFYAKFKEQGGGVIVNVVGITGERVDFNYISGSTGNAAAIALTKALGSRSLDDGVRVVGVNPGPIATDRFIKMTRRRAERVLGDADRWEELLSDLPQGRAGRCEEVASAVVFLASDLSSYTSGTLLNIDGGLSNRFSA